MTEKISRGLVYRCPDCGAEIVVLAHSAADFTPRCCNVAMVATGVRLCFYCCPVCGAEVVIIRDVKGDFQPRCCNTAMKLEAA